VPTARILASSLRVALLLVAVQPACGGEVVVTPERDASLPVEAAMPTAEAGGPVLPDVEPLPDPPRPQQTPPSAEHEAGLDAAGEQDAGTTALDAQITVPDAAADAGMSPVAAADAGRDTGPGGQAADAGLCADGFPRGSARAGTHLVQALDPGPEGVGACPDGDVLASAGEVLWRLPGATGPAEKLATLPGRSLESIVCDARGRVFVADISPMWSLMALRQPMFGPALMLIEPGAAARALEAPQIKEPALTGFNGLLEIPGVGLYTTDMLAGVIVPR
jgi:hypothetical protein